MIPMHKRIIAISFALHFIALAGCQERQATPVITASQTDPALPAVKIDGELGEVVWKTATAYDLVFDRKTGSAGQAPVEPGKVQFAYDDQYIYCAFSCADLDVIARGTEQDQHQYLMGDVVEVFLAPENQDFYWELHLTPTGLTKAFFFPSHGYLGMRDPLPAASPVLGGARVDGTLNAWSDTDHGWTAEMAIPLAMLTQEGIAKPPLGRWRILVGRYNYGRQLSAPEMTMYPIMPILWFHMTDRYATMNFQSARPEATR